MSARLRKALRRIDVANFLRRQTMAGLAARELSPIDSPARMVSHLDTMTTACRADAWTALAGGDAAEARRCLAEARQYRRQARLVERHAMEPADA